MAKPEGDNLTLGKGGSPTLDQQGRRKFCDFDYWRYTLLKQLVKPYYSKTHCILRKYQEVRIS